MFVVMPGVILFTVSDMFTDREVAYSYFVLGEYFLLLLFIALVVLSLRQLYDVYCLLFSICPKSPKNTKSIKCGLKREKGWNLIIKIVKPLREYDGQDMEWGGNMLSLNEKKILSTKIDLSKQYVTSITIHVTL